MLRTAVDSAKYSKSKHMLVYMPVASGLAIHGDIFRTMTGLSDDTIASTGHGTTLSEGTNAAGEPPRPEKKE